MEHTSRHARANPTPGSARRHAARAAAICFTVAFSVIVGLPLLWSGLLLVAGLVAWGCLAAVENLRKAQDTFDRLTRPPGR